MNATLRSMLAAGSHHLDLAAAPWWARLAHWLLWPRCKRCRMWKAMQREGLT